ncbi:hypothetical protein OC846_004605 [Tilletia horrida]|uniref:Uncharacterized protein n=1 Tax=Tilletia horrida TaxID=155126 RepID=A0AAN6GSD1_9BASI|nr:hypothetical protein OC846_004605 [Tilletia horrida]KAK0564168.1 hypothetical protein OC861_004425 [Tilletia horrida]
MNSVQHMLQRRAPVDFNATHDHPVFAKLNASAMAVLQADADKLASPVQVDGFSVSILVAIFAIYMLSLLSMGFLKMACKSRYLALPYRTQRQCGGFLASALVMCVPQPFFTYALSAAKWDINAWQIRGVRIGAIIVCAFSLFDLIHRERNSVLLLVQRTIGLGAISFQVYMLNKTQDPSFILTLSGLLFMTTTEAPAYLGLLLYKLRFGAKITKFVLRLAAPQTIFVKAVGSAIGVYVWTKYQRQNSTNLGRANSVVYLASLIGLFTCQVLVVIPLHKLAGEIDERYEKKGPLQLSKDVDESDPKKRKGRNRRNSKGVDQDGHLTTSNGGLKRYKNDRMSTFNMNNLGRDSLEMDEKRMSDDLESSYKSVTPSSARNEQGGGSQWAPSNIRDRLRSLSPLGRQSPSFSRSVKSGKRDSYGNKAFASSSQYQTSTSKGDGAYGSEARNVPVLNFNGAPEGAYFSSTPASSSGRASTDQYASPPTTRKVLDDAHQGSANLSVRQEDFQPQIIVSAASSTDHGRESDCGSTLNDHSYSTQLAMNAAQHDENWRKYSPATKTTSSTPSTPTAAATTTSATSGTASRQPVQRVTGFAPHQYSASSSLSQVDETSRYALGIVQEYLEPESPAASVHENQGYTSAQTTPTIQQQRQEAQRQQAAKQQQAGYNAYGELDSRNNNGTGGLYTQNNSSSTGFQPSYSVSRNASRPRLPQLNNAAHPPSASLNRSQQSFQSSDVYGGGGSSQGGEAFPAYGSNTSVYQSARAESSSPRQYETGTPSSYYSTGRSRTTSGTEAPPFLTDLG